MLVVLYGIELKTNLKEICYSVCLIWKFMKSYPFKLQVNISLLGKYRKPSNSKLNSTKHEKVFLSQRFH